MRILDTLNPKIEAGQSALRLLLARCVAVLRCAMAAGQTDMGQQLIEAGREQMARDLASGASGIAVCQSLSRVYDGLVSQLWDTAMLEMPEARHCGFALVALGGWGREEMCPYSDIDFVILAEPTHVELAQELADKILY